VACCESASGYFGQYRIEQAFARAIGAGREVRTRKAQKLLSRCTNSATQARANSCRLLEKVLRLDVVSSNRFKKDVRNDFNNGERVFGVIGQRNPIVGAASAAARFTLRGASGCIFGQQADAPSELISENAIDIFSARSCLSDRCRGRGVSSHNTLNTGAKRCASLTNGSPFNSQVYGYPHPLDDGSAAMQPSTVRWQRLQQQPMQSASGHERGVQLPSIQSLDKVSDDSCA